MCVISIRNKTNPAHRANHPVSRRRAVISSWSTKRRARPRFRRVRGRRCRQRRGDRHLGHGRRQTRGGGHHIVSDARQARHRAEKSDAGVAMVACPVVPSSMLAYEAVRAEAETPRLPRREPPVARCPRAVPSTNALVRALKAAGVDKRRRASRRPRRRA